MLGWQLELQGNMLCCNMALTHIVTHSIQNCEEKQCTQISHNSTVTCFVVKGCLVLLKQLRCGRGLRLVLLSDFTISRVSFHYLDSLTFKFHKTGFVVSMAASH